MTPGNLNSFSDRIVDTLVCHNDISSLAERRNNRRNGRERLRVNDASLRAQERSNVRLNLHVHILGAVEARRSTRSYAICPQRLYSSLFKIVIRGKVVEVQRGKIRCSAAVGKFDSRSRGSGSRQAVSAPARPLQKEHLQVTKGLQVSLTLL